MLKIVVEISAREMRTFFSVLLIDLKSFIENLKNEIQQNQSSMREGIMLKELGETFERRKKIVK